MNGNGEVAVQALLDRAEAAAASLPTGEKPYESLLAYLLGAIAQTGVADLDDFSTAVETYERDVQRRLGGAS